MILFQSDRPRGGVRGDKRLPQRIEVGSKLGGSDGDDDAIVLPSNEKKNPPNENMDAVRWGDVNS